MMRNQNRLEKNPIDQDRLDQPRTAAGVGPVLILTHDNPDPDALASGKALATMLREAWDIRSRLVYSGLVAWAENRVMLNHLTPEWEHADALPGLEQYSALALVDSQPTAGNNRLPASHPPHIVLDHHHPLREALATVPYADVRPEIGATVSLVYLYLEAAGVEPDPLLATAMFYGLKVDTLGLSRGASPTDEAVYVKLLSWVDRRKLVQVEQARLPRVYFGAFCHGLEVARLHGQAIVAYLGPVHRPDLPAEIADLLIRLEGARAALCLGRYRDTLHLSLRTVPLGQDAGLLIQEIVVPPGKAGGHGTMAGGQVTLTGQDVNGLVAGIQNRYLAALGETGDGEDLLI
jgi:nanoRNase/pAp phosphatase (c-di-AMP/oligoRNAs hydrolase)